MNEISPPVQSVKTLLISSVVAVIIAAIVFFVAVLPAEFGKDPTGLGKAMGLLVLSKSNRIQKPQVKQPIIVQIPATLNLTEKTVEMVPPEQIAQTASNQSSAKMSRYREGDAVTLMIPAGIGLEYKFHLLQGETMQYHWKTDGDKLYFDFHGEPQGDTSGYFKSYIVKTEQQSKGSFSAPFEGSHGWYWENKHSHPIKVELVTSGHYDIIGKINAH